MKTKLWRAAFAILAGVLMAIGCTRLLQAQAGFGPVEIPSDSRYLSDRLLLVGTEVQLNTLETSPTYTARISRTQRVSLSFLGDVARVQPVGGAPAFPPFSNGELSALRMDVVRLKLQLCVPPCTNKNNVETVISQVNVDPNFRVLAMPDYIAFDNDWNINANPKWGIGGSPLLTGSVAVSAELYRAQFDHLTEFGMSPLADQDRPYGVSGKNVLMGIFDTSPFSLSNNGLDHINVNGKTLSVTHMSTVPSNTIGITTTPNISGHGLFVAGVINAVAPDTSLHLYRVLNDNGVGDEATLIQGLTEFLSVTKHRPAIVNLSLGIFAPPTTTIEPLHTVLSGMKALSTTIVAAAGNDSYLTTTYDMHLPAAYDFVIGVAAANTQGQRACYSNKGNIAAPGGDGDTSNGQCEPPKQYFCPNDPQCMLASWWNPTAPPTMTAGVGTSYATPFVSAAAALVMEQRLTANQAVAPSVIANALYDAAIPRGPELGAGTLSLTNLFYKPRIYLPMMQRNP